jgi:hypothetical protein
MMTFSRAGSREAKVRLHDLTVAINRLCRAWTPGMSTLEIEVGDLKARAVGHRRTPIAAAVKNLSVITDMAT